MSITELKPKPDKTVPYFDCTTSVDVDIDPDDLHAQGWHHENECPAGGRTVPAVYDAMPPVGYAGPASLAPGWVSVTVALESLHEQAHGAGPMMLCRAEPCASLSLDQLRGGSLMGGPAQLARRRGDLAERLIPKAVDLACTVHGDGDVRAVEHFLAALSPWERDGLLVILAGLMPVDVSVEELLRYVTWDELGRPLKPPVPPCGTPAGLWHHQVHDQLVDDDCAATSRESRMAEYARLRDSGENLEMAAARVPVCRRTAERYEAALIAAGEAPWKERERNRAA